MDDADKGQVVKLEESRTECKQTELALAERMKDLRCLYGIARITEKPGITLDEIYQEVTDILPTNWQYPEIACARIIIGDNEFKTENYRESECKQLSDIKVYGKKIGIVEVSYLKERQTIGKDPFLKEERLLIDAVAERLGGITERKQAEEALRVSEERLRSVTENTSDHIMLVGQDLKIQFINKTVPDLKKEDVIGRSVTDFIPKDSLKLAYDKLHSVFNTGKPANYQTEYLTAEDGIHYFDVRLSPVTSEGKVISVVSSSNDVTERKKAELALERKEAELAQYREHLEVMVKERTAQLEKTNKELKREMGEREQVCKALGVSEQRLKSFMQSATVGFALYDSELNLVDINKSALKVLGQKREEMLGKNMQTISPDIKATGRYDRYMEVMKTGRSFSIDDVTPNAKFGNIHLALSAFKAGDGLGITFTNITERMQMMEKLKVSEERYHTLFNSGNDAIFVHQPAPDNLPGKFIEVNDIACKMLGYTRKELSQLTPNDIIASDKIEVTLKETIAKLRTVRRGIFESAFNSKKGTQIPVEVNIHLFDLGGRPTILTIARDITKRKQADKELREKELRIRELASAYVHAQEEERQWMALEIHDRVIQPMSAIYQQIQSVQSKVPIDQQAQRDIASSLVLTKNTIRDTKQLIHDLYPTTLTRYGLIKLMNEEICQLQSAGCQTKMSISPQLSPPKDIETTLYRVFHEALLNIKKHARAKSVAISLSGMSGAIELVVEDDGIGFNVAAKTSQRAPGGLESMRRRTEIIGGIFKVSSVPDQGTRLTFIIPLTKGNICKVARQ